MCSDCAPFHWLNESAKEAKSREAFIGEIKNMERADWLYGIPNQQKSPVAWIRSIDTTNALLKHFQVMLWYRGLCLNAPRTFKRRRNSTHPYLNFSVC
jgi:hypothetical protein